MDIILKVLPSRLEMVIHFFAEFTGEMIAMKIASSKNWSKLWIESDSKLVTIAMSNPSIVP